MVRAHLLQNYLTEAHRDAPGTGCAMGALLGDMTRGSKSARALYTARVKRSLAFFSALLPSSQRSDKRGRALLIGLSEIAGAVGIVLPMAVNIVPSLSPAAAAGLATVMLLAVFYHVRHREPPTAPATLFLLALFVAVGRFARWA